MTVHCFDRDCYLPLADNGMFANLTKAEVPCLQTPQMEHIHTHIHIQTQRYIIIHVKVYTSQNLFGG